MTGQGDLFMALYEVGDRVELSPATDRWMRGDRFGEVVKIGHYYLHVKLDRSGQVRRFVPEHVQRKVA